MIRFSICAVTLLTVATPAFAQQANSDANPVSVTTLAKPGKVCRSMPVTGRRITETKCYTAAQWAEYDRVNKEAADKMVNDVTARGNLGGDFTPATMFGFAPHQ